MNNFIKKSVISLLLVSMVCTIIGCGKNIDNNSSSNDAEIEDAGFKGTHIFNIEETSEYLVRDGQTDYKLVCNPTSELLKIAQEEFVYFFKKATDIDIKVIQKTDELKHTANNKYIVIGENELTKSANIDLKEDVIKTNGVRVVTKDNSIYLCGTTDRSSLYSVYTFFETAFNLKVFNRETYLIEEGVTEKKLSKYDITDVPDIEMRCGDRSVFAEATKDHSHYSSRMKMDAEEKTYLLPIHEEYNTSSRAKGTGHNSFVYLPKRIYNDSKKAETFHPKWFSNSQEQLCYTAHGDKAEFDLMTDEVAKKIEFSLQNYTPEMYPYIRAAHIGLEDGQAPCECDSCKELAKTYGTDSGAKVIFCNEVCKKVKAWMSDPENAQYKRDDFKIIFFAYAGFEGAPAKWDETQNKYVPIDERVVFDDMLGVYYAPITYLEYQKSIDDPVNAIGKQITEKWASLTDTIYLWTYDSNFSSYMYMYDSINFYSKGYEFFAKNHGVNIMRQGNSDANCSNVTAWAMLKAYLFAKLTWNTSLKTGDLIDEYFDAVYREAAPIMKKIFTETRLHMAQILTENNMYMPRSIYEKITYAKYWPISTLKNWLKDYDEAFEAIEKYKDTNTELYNTLYRNITLEWISPTYIMFDLYKEIMNDNDYNNLLNKLKENYPLVAPMYIKEHGGAGLDRFIADL